MCEMCSLIVTSWYFPTGTHRPLHMTKIQIIKRTLDNNVIQKRPFCPILSLPSMSPWCDMLRLTHSNVFQMCPSVSALIRCHRALHYFIFHSRMPQIKTSSLFWPTADARQRSPRCLIGFALLCCITFGKSQTNYHHLIYLTSRITTPILRSQPSDLTSPKCFVQTVWSGSCVSVTFARPAEDWLQDISRSYLYLSHRLKEESFILCRH